MEATTTEIDTREVGIARMDLIEPVLVAHGIPLEGWRELRSVPAPWDEHQLLRLGRWMNEHIGAPDAQWKGTIKAIWNLPEPVGLDPEPTFEELVRQVRALDDDKAAQESEAFHATMVCFCAALFGADAAAIAKRTGYPIEQVLRFEQRLRENGAWIGRYVNLNQGDPDDPESAGNMDVGFWLDVSVALGETACHRQPDGSRAYVMTDDGRKRIEAMLPAELVELVNDAAMEKLERIDRARARRRQ